MIIYALPCLEVVSVDLFSIYHFEILGLKSVSRFLFLDF